MKDNCSCPYTIGNESINNGSRPKVEEETEGHIALNRLTWKQQEWVRLTMLTEM